MRRVTHEIEKRFVRHNATKQAILFERTSLKARAAL